MERADPHGERHGGRPLMVAVRALGLGDLLTAVPALRALADAYPDHRRVLAAPAELEPLARLSGALDAVAPTAPLAPLAPELEGADVAVNLHGRGPDSHRVLLAARPRRLVAFAHADVEQTADAPRWREQEHEVARWCRLLEESGIPADASRLDLAAPAERPPEGAVGATVVHPGSAFAARRWPADRWAAVARHEARGGRRVVITGSRREAGLARHVARLAGLPASSVLAGATDLTGLAAVVAGAGRVVCCDTGVAHLATALRTPSVILFGPDSPARWGPPRDRPWHRALWAGRRGDPRACEPDPGLLLLQVADVLGALEGLPAADRPPRPLRAAARP